MAIEAPYLNKREIRDRSHRFLENYLGQDVLETPIEFIAENEYDIDIIPTPGMKRAFDVDACISSNLKSMFVDEGIYQNVETRYRFSVAHELAHVVLHPHVWQQMTFQTIEEWKAELSNSISEKAYGWLEWQANEFAGHVLVPGDKLDTVFWEAVAQVENAGLDPSTEAAKLSIANGVGDKFNVSRAVADRRIRSNGFWEQV